MSTKNEVATKATPASKKNVSKTNQSMKGPRDPVRYAIDKSFEAVGDELDRMEQEKPGTRRKLAGVASIGVGVTGLTAGVYLLTS